METNPLILNEWFIFPKGFILPTFSELNNSSIPFEWESGIMISFPFNTKLGVREFDNANICPKIDFPNYGPEHNWICLMLLYLAYIKLCQCIKLLHSGTLWLYVSMWTWNLCRMSWMETFSINPEIISLFPSSGLSCSNICDKNDFKPLFSSFSSTGGTRRTLKTPDKYWNRDLNIANVWISSRWRKAP